MITTVMKTLQRQLNRSYFHIFKKAMSGRSQTDSHQLTEAQTHLQADFPRLESQYPFLKKALETTTYKDKEIIINISQEILTAELQKIDTMELKLAGAYWPLEISQKIDIDKYPDTESRTISYKVKSDMRGLSLTKLKKPVVYIEKKI